MAELLERVVRREPLLSAGMSGSLLERGWLDDGSAVVIKHVDAASDWIMQATADGGRIAALWSEGFFQRVPGSINHAMLDVQPAPGGAVVVMQDMTASMFGDDGMALRSCHARVLRAASSLHQAAAERPHTRLCALRDLYAFLSPPVCSRFADHEVPRQALEGWARFPEVVPGDVADAVAGER